MLNFLSHQTLFNISKECIFILTFEITPMFHITVFKKTVKKDETEPTRHKTSLSFCPLLSTKRIDKYIDHQKLF